MTERAVVVIRRRDSLLVCYEKSVDPAALEAAAAEGGASVELDVDGRALRIRAKSSRSRQCAERLAQKLAGDAPVIDLS